MLAGRCAGVCSAGCGSGAVESWVSGVAACMCVSTGAGSRAQSGRYRQAVQAVHTGTFRQVQALMVALHAVLSR